MNYQQKKQVIEEFLIEYYDSVNQLESELALKQIQVSAIKSQIKELEYEYINFLCDETNHLVILLDNKWPEFDSTKNWKENFKYENGNYINKCINCNNQFFGHKRRVMCKECVTNKL